MRKPVIGTYSSGTPEIINDGVNGLLVPVKSPDALAKAIETLADNKKYADYLAANVHRRLIDSFSVADHRKQIEELYLRGIRSTGNW